MLPRPESANPMSIQTTPRPGRALAVAVLAAACWAVPVAGTAAAQESAQEIQKLLAEIQATKDQTLQVRSQAIRPMKVNGVEVSPDRFRREAIFLVGAKTVEAKIAELFVAQEIQQLVASGRDAKDFEITDDEVIADVAGVVEQFRLQNPGVEFWQAIRAQFGMDRERFLSQRKQTKLFDRVFFPGPANEWPLITKEAIMASATGRVSRRSLRPIRSWRSPERRPC